MSAPVRISVTFTGADDRTTIDDVYRICDEAEHFGVHVEFGLLCSATRGGTPRYPSPRTARHLARVAVDEHATVAVHVCGSYARATVEGGSERDSPLPPLADVLPEQWVNVFCAADRVQINLSPEWSTPVNLRRARLSVALVVQRDPRDMRRPLVIGQHRESSQWPAQEPGLQWLYDPSGGRGVAPESLPSLPTWRIGLAGGLGPSTVGAAARHLAAGAGGWLDMETRVRNADDRLCPDLCCQVLREVAEATKEGA